MITDKMEDFNSNLLLIISDNFITRMRMNEVDFISFKICKISAIRTGENHKIQSKYSLSGIRQLTFQMKASYKYYTTISVSTMAKKLLHDKKSHHVGMWTAESTCFEKQYICMMWEVKIKFIFLLQDYASLGK
jgi:hypothetical protein